MSTSIVTINYNKNRRLHRRNYIGFFLNPLHSGRYYIARVHEKSIIIVQLISHDTISDRSVPNYILFVLVMSSYITLYLARVYIISINVQRFLITVSLIFCMIYRYSHKHTCTIHSAHIVYSLMFIVNIIL